MDHLVVLTWQVFRDPKSVKTNSMATAKNFIFRTALAVLLFTGQLSHAIGQLTHLETSGNSWQSYGQVKFLGPAKASLEYIVGSNDTTFLLLMYDMRPELNQYFSLKFSSRDNTLEKLYETLMSTFDKKQDKQPNGLRIFLLNNEKVSVYRSTTIGARAILLSTDKGKIELTKGEIRKLFNK